MDQAAIGELVVRYDGSRLSEKVERRRRQLQSRLLSLGITVAIMIGLYLWRRQQMQGVGFGIVYGLVFGASLAWVAAVAVLYLRARRELATLGQGTAIRIGPAGVEVAGVGAPWPQVGSLSAVKAGLGRPIALVLTLIDGRTGQVPLDQVDVYPATLDSTARAFSGGRVGVSLDALES